MSTKGFVCSIPCTARVYGIGNRGNHGGSRGPFYYSSSTANGVLGILGVLKSLLTSQCRAINPPSVRTAACPFASVSAFGNLFSSGV